VGDVHAPWIHKPTFSKILQIVESFKPEIIVQIGDIYDMLSYSRFPKNPNTISPEVELQEGRAVAEEMWKLLQKKSNKAKCYQILGNHDVRPAKKAMELAPELATLIGNQTRALFEFEDVQTIHDHTQELILGEICFIHGYRSKLGDHCKHNMMNTVVGHSHRGGTFFMPTIKGKKIWELNAGYVANPAAEPLRYSQQKYIHWTHGVGLVDYWGPRFIPL
jgi:hypothetical protein